MILDFEGDESKAYYMIANGTLNSGTAFTNNVL